MTIRFWKVHGLGNDFMVLGHDQVPDGVAPETARRWCQRRFGVGADGVVVGWPSTRADARMQILNADGSEPEMCGNGLRALVVDMARRDGFRRESYQIETGAGVLECLVRGPGVDKDPMVSVQIGRASFEGEGSELEPVSVDVEGRALRVFTASVGNPHALFLVPDGSEPGALAQELGHRLSTHDRFPEGVNAGFGRLHEDRLELVVYERGVGLTLACGTGACAAVAMLDRLGLVDGPKGVTVSLPGGDLEVRVGESTDPQSGPITMVGPARPVFEGTLFEGWMEQR